MSPLTTVRSAGHQEHGHLQFPSAERRTSRVRAARAQPGRCHGLQGLRNNSISIILLFLCSKGNEPVQHIIIKPNNLNLVSLRPSTSPAHSWPNSGRKGPQRWEMEGTPALTAPLRPLLPLLLRSCWGCRGRIGACLHIHHPRSKGKEK